MSELYTKREAAHLLGIDRNTLAKWARECGITTAEDPRDKRPHLLSAGDLRVIRERYADRHTFGTSPAYRQQTISGSSADLEARLAAVERIVADLQQRLAANLTPPIASTVYTPPRRLTATTASYKHNPERPPVPPHLMTIPQWCDKHHKRAKTVWHWKRVGKLPVVVGNWLEGSVRYDEALALEGRQIAHQLAGIPWPCERCMLSAESEAEETNGTPSTHAVVEGVRDLGSVTE